MHRPAPSSRAPFLRRLPARFPSARCAWHRRCCLRCSSLQTNRAPVVTSPPAAGHTPEGEVVLVHALALIPLFFSVSLIFRTAVAQITVGLLGPATCVTRAL